MRFSVIIPVFNSELFLKECIDSVLNQSYSDFELILIDDESTDNSLHICEYYGLLFFESLEQIFRVYF